jgi:hypothetical protein
MDTKQVWRRVLGLLRRWKLIFKDSMMTKADCLSGDHLDLAGSDAAGERLNASRFASLPSSPAMKKMAGPGTWTTPTSVLVDGFASP